MRFFGYPYNDLVICKDSPDYLVVRYNFCDVRSKDAAIIM